MRPPEEYQPVTDDEWEEFEAHFDKRKVELGTCGRPYATPCIHEHACVRCPLLNVDPRMLHRLDDIETISSPDANEPGTKAGRVKSKASTSPWASCAANAPM
jgi:hypothetical protein